MTVALDVGRLGRVELLYASVSRSRAWLGSSVTRSMPGPMTWARSACAWSRAVWPALTELMASCWPRAAEGVDRQPEPTDDDDQARIARAARRCVSRREASGVTRR